MADHENPEFLGSRPVGALLWEFSLPSIIAAIVSASYNIVARIFVGRTIGAVGIAALHVSFPFMLIALAFAMMIGTGASTLISIELGKKENDSAERILGQALFMFLAVSALFVVFGLIYIEPMLVLFGASENVLPLAKEYLSIIIWGVVFQEISFGVNNFIRIEGKPKIAMITMVLSAVLNGILDYVFLFVFKTGIWGAAVSNLIALAVTSLWVCGFYLSGRTVLKWRRRYLRPNLSLAWKIAVFGTVPLATQVCSAVIQGVQNHMLGHYGAIYGALRGIGHGGDLAISVMGTVFSVSTLFLMPLLGLSQGMQPIVGYNVGAEEHGRVHRTLRLTLRLTLSFCFALWGVIMLHPDWFILPFLKQGAPEYQENLLLGCRALRVFSSLLPLVGINIISGGYFQAHGRPILSLFLTLLRQLFFLIPSLILLPFLFEKVHIAGIYGLDGVWSAHAFSDLLAGMIAIFFLVREYLRHARRAAGL
ncbi:MAG: MATE family efflux transporter [Thermoguttaceae bacterium]|nr:MATE family efflux transporter [Thermoguttaceae bacterium]